MRSTDHYFSPLGRILLTADAHGLTGLWFEGQQYAKEPPVEELEEGEAPILRDAKRWLDIYFSGKEPTFRLPLHPVGTDFQMSVWELLADIPYGETVTYRQLAEQLARARGIAKMSAQAVGGAVGKNKIAILLPCHRVIGTDGSLTGYAGGLDRKSALLRLEQSVLI